MKWSMEGVHRVVHGRGPGGGPWTGDQCFQLSQNRKETFIVNLNRFWKYTIG